MYIYVPRTTCCAADNQHYRGDPLRGHTPLSPVGDQDLYLVSIGKLGSIRNFQSHRSEGVSWNQFIFRTSSFFVPVHLYQFILCLSPFSVPTQFSIPVPGLYQSTYVRVLERSKV